MPDGAEAREEGPPQRPEQFIERQQNPVAANRVDAEGDPYRGTLLKPAFAISSSPDSFEIHGRESEQTRFASFRLSLAGLPQFADPFRNFMQGDLHARMPNRRGGMAPKVRERTEEP